MKEYDIVIIGGGPAGLAAAVMVRGHGIESILILKRNRELGEILNKRIHNGFDLHTFREELAGPECTAQCEEQVFDRGIEHRLNTMVMGISRDKMVVTVNREEGLFEIRARAVVLAMGYRERSRDALNTPGYRPADISSTGMVQHLMNMEGFMPSREVVILGSDDVGLIMARHMALEGARVRVMAELMPYSGGLRRNIVQCLNGYDIPLKPSHTVVNVRGEERLVRITLAIVDKKGEPIPGTEEDYDYDTLLLSMGLIPENELSGSVGVKMSRITSGPTVDKSLEANMEGVFVCGNVLHVRDPVDFVSEEAVVAGKNAAKYVMKGEMGRQGHEINLKAVDGMCYTVPYTVSPQRMEDIQVVRFRVGNVYKNRYIGIHFDSEQVMHKKRPIMAPGEMEETKLEKEKLLLHPEPKTITIKVGEAWAVEKKELICIGYPIDCPLTVELEDGEIPSITRHTCRRGEVYARKEVTGPTRIVTPTVDVEGGKVTRISVKTKEDIPKEKIFQYVKTLRGVTMKAPVHIGNVVITSVANAGVDIVTTRGA